MAALCGPLCARKGIRCFDHVRGICSNGKAAQALEIEDVNETRLLDAAEQAGRIQEIFMTAAKSKKRKAVDLNYQDLDV